MENDLHKTFGQISGNDITTLRRELIDVQNHRANRKASEKWVKQLRFLDISKVPDLVRNAGRAAQFGGVGKPKGPCNILITRKCKDDGKVPYVAVSWKWPTHPDPRSFSTNTGGTYEYMIKRPGALPQKSDFPDECLDRVIMFAQSKKITKLWIDKECIYQRPDDTWTRDTELGVQIMDVVYGDSAASVGLLTTPIEEQDDVDALASLLAKSVFVEPHDIDAPKLSPMFNPQMIQSVVLRILSDARWSRGWIFQEDHLASDNMTLLIPCDASLGRSSVYDFGSLPHDLKVKLKHFKEAVTMFCMASPGDDECVFKTEVLSKAKQYNIWNKNVDQRSKQSLRDGSLVSIWTNKENGYAQETTEKSRVLKHDNDLGAKMKTKANYDNVSFYPTMTNSVLDDISTRSLTKEEDRIAILANALRFSKRLDISPTSPILGTANKKYTLSIALLALILINGEILMNREHADVPSDNDIMSHTLRSYLKRCEYRFNAPNLRFQQSFINRCRFKEPTITHRGVQTKGFLFTLLSLRNPAGNAKSTLANSVRLTPDDRASLTLLSKKPSNHAIKRNQKLSIVARHGISTIIVQLRRIWPHSRLAVFLDHHIELDRNPLPQPPLSTRYVLDMLSAIFQALCDGREMRLARRVGEREDADPTAIFIAPEPHGWSTKGLDEQGTMVFTSWDNPRGKFDAERLVSLEVAAVGGKGVGLSAEDREGCCLRSYGWVNGVSVFRGARMESYVFPLPGISEVLYEDGTGVKRKRFGDVERNVRNVSRYIGGQRIQL